ncbi:MAG: MFS transporter [Bacteroidetes bacterium]|nr:MFS transporter [Bacteroidota bacterium]
MDIKKHILPIIVLSQFAGTSTWFAGNAVLKDIAGALNISVDVLPHVVSAVQLGFITGTLLFSIFTITDRFSPSRIFFVCSMLGALSNLSLIWACNLMTLLTSRYITGFFLAGIYPVGMKIAADYHHQGLGKVLGYLVGALVLGTAFPYLLHATKAALNWHYVIICVSVLSGLGGAIILFAVPDGPHRTSMSKPDFLHAFKLFRNRDFRLAAFGYFGHMWELYTFWALVPSLIINSASKHSAGNNINTSLLSFFVIASGSAGCVIGGYISLRRGNIITAFIALLLSGICCLLLPFAMTLPITIFLPFMLVWGMAVVADSPQFTSLIAQSAEPSLRGTALTVVNCIGFAITVVSMQLIAVLQKIIKTDYVYWVLTIGPIFGFISIYRKALVYGNISQDQ